MKKSSQNQTTQTKDLKLKSVSKMSNEELMQLDDKTIAAKNLLINHQINKNTKSIANNMSFFFWITILSIIIGVFLAVVNA